MNVPWVLEKNVYSDVVEWHVLQMLIRSCWLVVVSFFVSLMIFCLVVLSVAEREVLKPPTIVVDLSIFICSISFCFICFTALLFGAYTFKIVMSS